MFLKQISGLLLGLFIGGIPLANSLAATLFAFYNKKKKAALFYAIVTGLLILFLGVSFYYDHKEKAVKPAFLQTFKEQLAAVYLKNSTAMDSAAVKVMVSQTLTQTATAQIEKEVALESLLKHAREDKFSGKARTAFNSFCQCLYSGYLEQTNTRKGKDRFDRTFDSTAINNCEPGMIGFVDAYLESEHGSNYELMLALIGLTYLISWVGCVSNARNLFVTASEPPVHDTTQSHYSNLFPPQGAPTPPVEASPPPLPRTAPSYPPPPPPPLPPMVSINTADEGELMQLRGVNRILAKSIITERNTGGNFTDINDLKKRMDFSREQIDGMSASLSFDAPRGRGGRVIEY